jgi:tripartite ATP-independent transporter DctM subunit
VVTLGVLSLPVMLRGGYDARLATGTIAASGTLGQIIPPSVVLVLLGDLLSVSVGDLFMGALIPGVLLVLAYLAYVLIRVHLQPALAPLPADAGKLALGPLLRALAAGLLPTGGLIALVLGTILYGVATPTEAAACGAVGAILIALVKRRLSRAILREASMETAKMTAMVFAILAGAQIFTVVFRGNGGEHWLTGMVAGMDPGPYMAVAIVMVLIFVLGFFLDFLEICFIVIPMVLPVLRHVGWTSPEQMVLLGVLIGVNLQTSFLTPPFGFSLFYLKGCAPPEIRTSDIYRGAIPFIGIQLAMLVVIVCFPDLVLWLPRLMGKG